MLDKDYQRHERACKRIKAKNAKLLVGFEQWLSQKNLAEKTSDQHLKYIDFYINTFLLDAEAVPARNGVSEVWSFFGDWFIRKTTWSRPTSVKRMAASLEKFYTYMHERGEIDGGDLQRLKLTLKADLPDWVAMVRNDGGDQPFTNAENLLEIVTMNLEEAKIKARLEEVLESIFCPDGGGWCLHGGHYEYYYDEGCESHVLEVWPVGFQEAEEGDNGRKRDGECICYEFAEFEFGEMMKEVPLEHLHFSQRRQIFEIGWKEGGRDLELRVHIVPVEVECE